MVVTLYAYSGTGGTPTPEVTPTRGTAVDVPPDTETTVVSHLVPGGYSYKLHGIVATGDAPAEWVLYDNATEVFRTRTSGEARGIELLQGNAIPFAAGHTVYLKVLHAEDDVYGSTNRTFYATLLGRDA